MRFSFTNNDYRVVSMNAVNLDEAVLLIRSGYQATKTNLNVIKVNQTAGTYSVNKIFEISEDFDTYYMTGVSTSMTSSNTTWYVCYMSYIFKFIFSGN